MRKVASPATPTAPPLPLSLGAAIMIMHMSIQISQSEREEEGRMCEGSQGGQSRQAFILALLRDAREGKGEVCGRLHCD